MAGKRGKKNRSTGDMGTVSSGLLPSAAFAAVPRTPPPATPPGTLAGLAMTSGVLNSSLLGRMFEAGQATAAAEEDPLSDPESSLYDYQMMEEAGYSSVEFRGGGRKRISYSEREKAPTPPLAGPGPSHEHAIDDPSPGDRFYHILEPQEKQTDMDLYAMPNKRGKGGSQKRQSTGEDSTLQQTGQRVREAMRAVRDMDSDSDAAGEEVVTKVTVERHPTPRDVNQKDESIRETSVKSNRLSARSLPSQKFTTEGIQTGDSLLESARAPKGSLSHRSGASTARSVDEITRSLEGENFMLHSQVEDLESEVHSLRQIKDAVNKGDSETASTIALKKQVKDLKEENSTLQSSVHRLSVELSHYQAKYRTVRAAEKPGELLGLPAEGPIPSWLINTKYLAPLFLAYDDRLQEKDQLINKYQDEMEKLRESGIAIVEENKDLHERLDNAVNRGPVDINEWEQLKENAKLVLEENQNLLEQLEVKDRKSQDLHQANVKEISKLTKQLVLVTAEKTDSEQELEELRKRYKDTKNKYDTLVLETQDKATAQEYINTIAQLKKNLADTENTQKEELENQKIKVQALENERRSHTAKMVEVVAENKRLQAEIKAMQRAVRKAQGKMMYLQRAIEQSENKEYSVQEQLANIIKLAEKTAFERDTYAKVAREQENETKKAVNKLLQGNVSKGRMEEKLKLYKIKAAAKLTTVAGRLKDQDESFNSQKKEYEREINHLRLILNEKEKLVDKVASDKREVESELEVMWQSANTENERMKDVMRKNMQKLRHHEALAEAMESSEHKELVYVSSDEN